LRYAIKANKNSPSLAKIDSPLVNTLSQNRIHCGGAFFSARCLNVARINIEDSLFKEKSYGKLMLKLGSQRMALGALVEAFSLAQKHYLNVDNDRLIPLDEWEREDMGNELIECGFAEVRKKGIYVRGSEAQFSWLLQRSDAGKKSQKIKAEKASATVDDRQRPSDGSQPLPLPLSLSQNIKKSKIVKKEEEDSSNKKFAEVGLQKIVDLWNLKTCFKMFTTHGAKSNEIKITVD
jgi:hypothetical protein